MQVLLNLELMCIHYKHSNPNCLADLCWIELPGYATLQFEPTLVELERFTDLELKTLYLNLCGQSYTGYGRNVLIQNVFNLIESLPESELNAWDIKQQSDKVPLTEEQIPYKYKLGVKPIPQEMDYLPNMLKTALSYQPVLHTSYAGKPAPAPATALAVLPKAPREKVANTAPAGVPKTGSKTGRVWEIADEVCVKLNATVADKSLRNTIIEACEAEGINSSTASVQYSKWKQTKFN